MTLKGPSLGSPSDLTGLASRRAAETPHAVALSSSSGSLTWLDLDRAVRRWSGVLAGLGLHRGDRVASLMPNHVDLVVHYLSCLRTGIVAVPLNYRYTAPQVDHALALCDAAALLVHPERAEDVENSKAVPALPLGIIWHGDQPDAGSNTREPGRDEPAVTGPGRTSPDEPAFIFFTSGSTGPAKGVTHTRTSLGWMTASAAAAFEMTRDDVFLPASSLSHIGALLWTLSALAEGAGALVAETFDGDEILALLRDQRPTLLAMIPAALTALVRDHGATAEDFSSIRVCRSGSDHVPAELEDEFLTLTGLPIDEGYGMTEVGLATLNPPSGEVRPGSIGKAVPGFRLSVRDPAGAEVTAGVVGEIWIETSSATTGYWGDRAATDELFHDGWVKSGDLARADGDGYLWFFGRSKQIIVHDGSNISPTEVEDALSEHPAVGLVGVVGVRDLVHGENVRAYVTLSEGAARPTSQELIRFARDRVGYRAPEEIVVLSALPLNATGKVDRARLKEMARDHRNPDRR